MTDSTPVFVTPNNGQSLTVYSGTNTDPRNTITIATNALAPMTLALAGSSSAHFTFFDNGNGTGQLVFNDPTYEYINDSFTLTASEKNLPDVSTSINFTVHANPVPPSIAGYTSGPLAFIVGTSTPQPPPTIVTDSTANIITPGDSGNSAPPPNEKLPAGLSFVNNANGSISIAGTPAVGSGGFYKVPITISNHGIKVVEPLNIVVYEAPTFLEYTATTL